MNAIAYRIWSGLSERGRSSRLWILRTLAAQGAILTLAAVGGSLMRPGGRVIALVAAAGFVPVMLWGLFRRQSDQAMEVVFSAYLVCVIATAGYTYRSPLQAQLAFACELVAPIFSVLFLSRRAVTWLCAVAGFAAVVGTIHLGGTPAQMVLRSSNVLIIVVLPGLVSSAYHERLVLANRQMEEARASAEQLSLTDPLTGLANRRGMTRHFSALHHEARRGGRLLGTLILDIDHFKQVNDHHGHDAGDVVLAEVAQVITAHCGGSDLVVRLGGEEFAVLMVAARPETLMERAQSLRTAIADRIGEHDVTVSIGVSCLEPDAPVDPQAEEFRHGTSDLLSALLRLADRQLYLAKAQGRDRAVGPAYVAYPMLVVS
jgi:diguanylate cyclase (GGDEF)-like protein